jgi:hypothetical protein
MERGKTKETQDIIIDREDEEIEGVSFLVGPEYDQHLDGKLMHAVTSMALILKFRTNSTVGKD